jgi:uncharacterized protein (DUF58 family)
MRRKRETWTEWIYPYRRLRFTRDGWFFLVITMAIGLAALNTGHNLFYLVFAMLVSLIVVSGLLSERAVRGLRVERRLPREVFARTPAVVELRLRNASTRRTSYAVDVCDGLEGEPRRVVGRLARLEPGASRNLHAVWTFERRGRHRFRTIHLVTRFPFGLFEKTRILPLGDEVVVFPSVDGERGRGASLDASSRPMRKHRLGEETLAVRPMLPEDDHRMIHWRSSARAGELLVRDPGQSADRPVAIFLENRVPAGDAFERSVDRAASLLWEGARDGRVVHLFTHEAAFPGLGRDSLRVALAFLAEIEAVPGARGGDGLARWRGEIARGVGGIVVTAGEAPSTEGATVLRVA